MSLIKLEKLGNLKLKEIEIFYFSAKTKSIREVARRNATTPGQISKIIKNVEKKMGSTLFKRSASGIVLSESGSDLVQLSEAILDSAYKMESRQRTTAQTTLAIAATPFLINHLVSIAAARALEGQNRYSLRLLDIHPDEIAKFGLRGAFEVVFHFNKMDWPRTWISEKVTALEWVLVARQEHPIKKIATLDEILSYPFIQPTYWTSEGLLKGNDFFEIPSSRRLPGYETSTADAAIPLLLRTNHLACLPRIFVQGYLDREELRLVKSPKIKGTKRDLFLSVKADALTTRIFARLRQEVGHVLGE